MRYVGGIDEAGRRSTCAIRWPTGSRRCPTTTATPADKVAALLGVREVFDADLAGAEAFRGAVTAAYQGLVEHGARAMVERTAG